MILPLQERGKVLLLRSTLPSGGGRGEVLPIQAKQNRCFLREGFEWDKRNSLLYKSGSLPHVRSDCEYHGVIAPALGYQVQQFYGRKERPFFDELYQQVNREALAPFFRSRLRREGPVLDAGVGSGHLAQELGPGNACFLDLTWEQMKQLQTVGLAGPFIQGDLGHLPYADNSFAQVICSNVLHYTGLAGLEELVRVTRPGGPALVAFLEGSAFTRAAVNVAVSLALFPPLMRHIPFIEIAALSRLGVQVEDSATVVFIPPAFTLLWGAPRAGLVAFALKKGGRATVPQRFD